MTATTEKRTRQMNARQRRVLEWLADRHSTAYEVARIADWLDLAIPVTQGVLSRLQHDGLVRYFGGHPGTWTVTTRGLAEIKVVAAS